MVHISTDMMKRKRMQGGEVPGVKKFERIGSDKFVIHTDSKDKFEGKFNPNTHTIVNGKMVKR